MANEEKRLKYERGEGRRKHRWNKPYAGFVPSERGPVGKCSNTITDDIAEQLLNDGIPWNDEDWTEDWPEMVYNVHDGAVYIAVPTQPGVSYHGYPFRGQLPRRFVNRLEEIACKKGCLKEFREWKKEYLT